MVYNRGLFIILIFVSDNILVLLERYYPGNSKVYSFNVHDDVLVGYLSLQKSYGCVHTVGTT